MNTDSDAKRKLTKQGSTIFLRITVLALGLMALGLGLLILPEIYFHWETEYPRLSYLLYPVLLLLGATIVPFFVALYQTIKLLDYIDTGRAFSVLSVKSLNRIKYSAAAFSGLYILFAPIMYMIAQEEDAPGLMVIGLMMVGAPIVVAVFATVLQKLLEHAIAMKAENDLTV